MLTAELQQTINRAFDEAIERRHEYLTLEHLLYALLHERTASGVVRHCGGDVDKLKRELETFFEETLEKVPEDSTRTPEQTQAFQRVIQLAVMQARSSGQEAIDGGSILAALFNERHSTARYLLEKQGITRLDVISYLSHGVSKIDDDEPRASRRGRPSPTRRVKSNRSGTR